MSILGYESLPTGRGFGLLMKESLAMVDIATATVYFASKKMFTNNTQKKSQSKLRNWPRELRRKAKLAFHELEGLRWARKPMISTKTHVGMKPVNVISFDPAKPSDHDQSELEANMNFIL